MDPASVTTDTVKVEGLKNISIVPVYLNEGDKYADTFTVTGALQQKEIKFTVTDSAKSYSGVSAEAASETIEEKTVIGDVNGDGEIDITDATMIQKALAELIQLTDEQKIAADTTGDGNITIDDVTMVQKYVAEMIDHF